MAVFPVLSLYASNIDQTSLSSVITAGAAAVILAGLGNFLVLHGFPLSNDEFLPRFQAQIFLAGKIKALVPSELREFGTALTPIYIIFDPLKYTWIHAYLPIYAVLRTGFLALGAEPWTLEGLSLVLLAAVARRLWPQEPLAPFLVLILPWPLRRSFSSPP